ncbi:hypothetical protein QQS21_012273 [Conoideocrella luteorostrata]|uniref:FAD dependent oxidoreductase domain-containing protein n=1 Tax=Conoideocrella luteorostrata TaxID=1105319 RepID=A0AAJ0CBH6_9HYPO|nr:hypothetical protein QQS21_012273 [Conoideocrella luteorostrata]
MANSVDFVVVGAGVFGASTAYHLARRFPVKRVILVDRKRPNPCAASSDYNKIIRADYKDKLYTELGLEALQLWKKDELFKPYFHQCGLLCVEEIGVGRGALEHFAALGHDSGAVLMALDEARNRFPHFQDADWTGACEAYFNPESGWAEADGALRSVIDAAVEAGVEFLEANVTSLAINDDFSCKGINIIDKEGAIERTILAVDQTILCVGAYTAKLLADTSPDWAELQVNGRMIAAAAVQCAASYPQEEEHKFSGAPCHFLGMWHTHGESIPPYNGHLKFNCEVSFTNLVHHEGLNESISVPPSAETQNTFSQDVPEGLKQEAQNVVKKVFGKYIARLQIESYRMCWDAVSPNQDWIIDHHPNCNKLLVAGAGSFHAWKFLPTIGKYVVQRMLGDLDDDKAQKWA